MIDSQDLGRRVRAARVLAGIENIGVVTEAIGDLGIVVSDRTLYAIERGEQPVAYDLLVALINILQPPGGLRFFNPAIREDLREQLIGLTLESDERAIERSAARAVMAGPSSRDRRPEVPRSRSKR